MKKVISIDPGELRIELPPNVVHLRKKVEGTQPPAPRALLH
jgi:hypothetical protein